MDNDKIKELFVEAVEKLEDGAEDYELYDALLDCINAIPNLYVRGYLIGMLTARDEWEAYELQEGLIDWVEHDIWDNQ